MGQHHSAISHFDSNVTDSAKCDFVKNLGIKKSSSVSNFGEQQQQSHQGSSESDVPPA
jgi:hypothetical protein